MREHKYKEKDNDKDDDKDTAYAHVKINHMPTSYWNPHEIVLRPLQGWPKMRLQMVMPASMHVCIVLVLYSFSNANIAQVFVCDFVTDL